MTPENDATPPNTGGATGEDKPPNTSDKRYRSRRGGFRKQPAPTGRPVLRQPKFEGTCEELKGHIYDCTDSRQSDVFIKTTKEIAGCAGRTFKKGSDARRAIENLSLPTLVPPADPVDDNKSNVRIWEKEIDAFVIRKTMLTDNMQTVYSIVWGQCTDVMKQKVEALPSYQALTDNGDGLALLIAIKDLVYNFQSQKYLSQALHDSKARFYACRQGRQTQASAYMEQFQNTVDVIEHSGGSIGHDPGVLKKLADDRGIVTAGLSEDERTKLKKDAQSQNLAASFILNLDRTRYGATHRRPRKRLPPRTRPMAQDAHSCLQSPHKLETNRDESDGRTQ
jgi:hypothetical protein